MVIASIFESLFNSLEFWFPAYGAWILLTITFFYAQKIEDNSIIDIAWGLGHIIQAGLQVYFKFILPNKSIHWRDLLVFGLITLWGLRISWHIGKRHSGEDWRYRDILRKRYAHKNPFVFKLKIYLLVFILQWFFMTISCMAACNTIINQGTKEVTYFDQIGTFVFALGIIIEALADYQLDKHLEVRGKAEKEGKKVNRFCQTGLWRYSRHPNYFGEVVVWWGIYIISLSNPNFLLGHIVNLLSPLTINFLLRRVSGVPFLEKKHMKDEEFKEYAERTPIFIPWIPKKIVVINTDKKNE
mmetsp:Transcript_32833/g.29129  ORF Transcript_32833/g.29129 Transcript_32833/m.29129 type:complete len:299 (+) Transcript_32833:31-927(+)